jgi:Sporulation and spore germination
VISRRLIDTTVLLLALALAMGIYLIHLEHEQQLTQQPLPEPQHVSPPPPSAAMASVTLWVANDETSTLRPQSVSVRLSSDRQQRAEDVLRALLKLYLAAGSPHRMGAASEIHDVYLAAPSIAIVDVNAAFADEQTSGVLAEELTLASFVQSLFTNVPGLLRVKFLIDGKDRDTLAGHADLTGFYDASQIAQLAKQLSQE